MLACIGANARDPMGAEHMSTYGVYLNEPNEEVWNAVKTNWPRRHYILTDTLAFVAPEGISTTAQVGESVGIGSPKKKQIAGMVFEVARIFGNNKKDMWEWLENAERDRGAS